MTSIDSDAAYWRKMYEERMALEEDGFGALLAERDRLRAEVDSMIVDGYTAAQRAENDRLRETLQDVGPILRDLAALWGRNERRMASLHGTEYNNVLPNFVVSRRLGYRAQMARAKVTAALEAFDVQS